MVMHDLSNCGTCADTSAAIFGKPHSRILPEWGMDMFYNIPKSADTENGAEKLRNAMMQADAVIIGVGAGLSTSAGFTCRYFQTPT